MYHSHDYYDLQAGRDDEQEDDSVSHTTASSPSGDRQPLVLAAGTLGTYDLAERIDAAAAAGFSGLGLRPEDYTIARDNGWSDAALRSCLDDAGLSVVELQSVHGWAGGEDETTRGREIEDGCYAVAQALGAQYMMVSNTTLACEWEEAVARFGNICDRAATHGLGVAIEFLPWGPVPDAATAWRLVSESGAPNAGVLVDSWHHFRGASDDDMIRSIPADRIMAIQIDDALAEPVGSLYDDTRHRRLPAGHGDLDLVGFVQLLDQHGVDAPWSVEILSDEQRALPPVEGARIAADTTWELLAQARSGARR
jgi:sugar phosphate isomerase/epimerase